MRKTKASENDNIIKYPKQYHVSLGFILIGIMFIYICYHIFTYVTSKNVTVYEVQQGSIANNMEYNALAIRQESVVCAPTDGSIIYMAENGGKISVQSNVYAIDESGEILSELENVSMDEIVVDRQAMDEISSSIESFTVEYDNKDFYRVYSFKNELVSGLEQLYSVSAMNALGESVNEAINSGNFHVYKSNEPGVVVFSVDGMENLKTEDVTDGNLDLSNYSVSNLKSNDSVNEGDAIYKIITSDKWKLVMEVDESVASGLEGNDYIKIRFLEDDVETWTSMELAKKDGKNYLILTLDDSMDRYASLRFVHVKLINNNRTGLKIPVSSIVEKEFFTIPKEYFYGGEDERSKGLLVEEKNNTSFVSTTIYYETDEFYYVDSNDIDSGATIIKANSNERYKVGTQTDYLKGVYNINKGYAVFKQIKILYKNEDYAIIKAGTDYGISMYDHIVLQGDTVLENDIINKR